MTTMNVACGGRREITPLPESSPRYTHNAERCSWSIVLTRERVTRPAIPPLTFSYLSVDDNNYITPYRDLPARIIVAGFSSY